MGGAVRARPGTRRVLSGIRQAVSCMTRGLAYPPAPLQGPSPGLPRPRSGQTTGDAHDADSGTDPDLSDASRSAPKTTGAMEHIQQIMSATGPVRCFAPRPPCGRQGTRSRPGGWLCTPLPKEDRPPAEPRWSPPPLTRCPTLGHHLRGIHSRVHRNVRDPSGSGSAASMTWGWKGWKRLGGCSLRPKMHSAKTTQYITMEIQFFKNTKHHINQKNNPKSPRQRLYGIRTLILIIGTKYITAIN